jgi:hypothetical protein
MEHYVGIDVSLELSSVCVVDAQGKIAKEAKVASDIEAGCFLRRQTGRYLLFLSFAGLTRGGHAGQKRLLQLPVC